MNAFRLTRTFSTFALLAGMAALGRMNATAAEVKERIVKRSAAGDDASSDDSKEKKIVIETIDADGEEGESSKKELPWLGVVTAEASEAVASQLGLDPGAGLVVSYVAAESPAAKAGLQKNDVLVKFEGQLLVLPVQLRKLVQMRKVGDTVKLAVYRAGKKEELSATLGKATGLHRQMRKVQIGDDVRDEMKSLHESLAHGGLDRDSVRIEVRQGMEEARRAIEEALRQAGNSRRTFGSAAKVLEELARSGVEVDKDATVTVKSSGTSVKTMVKADETGTYVIVADPKKRLTVHNKKGKMLFDEEIETPEQQEKMPKEIREKVKPMLEQMGSDGHEGQGSKGGAGEGSFFLEQDPLAAPHN